MFLQIPDTPTTTREQRRQAILALVSAQSIRTQARLQQLLAEAGHTVNQATLSRDLRDMGLVKSGRGYELPARLLPRQQGPTALGLVHAVHEWLAHVAPAQQLLVLKTPAGGASPLAVALDGSGWPGLLGTIAGDDTVLVVCANPTRARTLARRLLQLKGEER